MTLTTRELILKRIGAASPFGLMQGKLHEALRCRHDGRKEIRALIAEGIITKKPETSPGARGRRPILFRLANDD